MKLHQKRRWKNHRILAFFPVEKRRLGHRYDFHGGYRKASACLPIGGTEIKAMPVDCDDEKRK